MSLITFDSGSQLEVREDRMTVCLKWTSIHAADKRERQDRTPMLHTFSTKTGRPVTVDLWKIERVET